MKVSISVPGTFHAFDLGEQLQKRNVLEKIYTTYPRFKLDTTLPKRAVQPIRHPEALHRIVNRIPGAGRHLPTNQWKRSLFDAAVARNLEFEEEGLFIGFSGSTLVSIRRANELGMTTVVERCSSHIRTQASILAEEYQKYGFNSKPISHSYIEHEETEYREADYVITPSEFVYSSFLKQGVPEGKVLCEPYGVDPNRYTPGQQEDNTTTVFLFAGRVGLRKGIQYLLDAWDILDLDNAELRIAGGVEETGRRFIEQYRDDDSIIFLGWVDDIIKLYQDASVFVFPTLEEGSAYVTYEAMATQLPLITTAHSGWVGRDGEHGIEVPTRDTDAIVEAMKQLYENKTQRTKMGRNARELVEERYSWDRYGERIYDTYCNIVVER